MQQLRGKGWYLFPGEINAMVFTPDGRTLVTGSSADQGWDQHVRLWDIETRSISRWFEDHQGLKAVNRVLVDYHHQLEHAHVWGAGKVSSSDGQRFGIQASSLLASFYPRYFGYYDRAVTVYTHVSDQHSVFASQAISCAMREAIYVLGNVSVTA